jgi:hypothetical protein
MREKKLCAGSGHIVLGSDEPNGTVYCNKCGKIDLPMKTTITESGAKRHSVPEHDEPLAARRSHARPKRGSSGCDGSRRNRRNRGRR